MELPTSRRVAFRPGYRGQRRVTYDTKMWGRLTSTLLSIRALPYHVCKNPDFSSLSVFQGSRRECFTRCNATKYTARFDARWNGLSARRWVFNGSLPDVIWPCGVYGAAPSDKRSRKNLGRARQKRSDEWFVLSFLQSCFLLFFLLFSCGPLLGYLVFGEPTEILSTLIFGKR